MEAVTKARMMGKASVNEICSFFGLKRDAYYKYKKRLGEWTSVVSKVVDLVKKELNRENFWLRSNLYPDAARVPFSKFI